MGTDIDEKELQSKLCAVKGIARRAGYPEYKAEDISQQVALSILEGKNPKQNNFYAYVDALRSGSERAYTRDGHFTVPIYESAFEDYAGIVDALRCEADTGEREENECDVFDIVCALQKIERSRARIIILSFLYGWTLDRISKFERVSESRISQKRLDALKQIKKKIVQARLSSEKSCERKLKEYRAVSHQIQNFTRIQRKTEEKLASLCFKEKYFMAAFAVTEIPQALSASF